MKSVSQTTNLGVRSSNLFGRASNLLILIQNLCPILCLLTSRPFGAAPGQHQPKIGFANASAWHSSKKEDRKT